MVNYPNSQERKVVLSLAQTILDNKSFLSEVDGKIGDGDHGINMAKGFQMNSAITGSKPNICATAAPGLGTHRVERSWV